MNSNIRIILFLLLIITITSFKLPIKSTKIYMVALSPLIKAEVIINDVKLKMKTNSFAEFEVLGNEINCTVDIKLPLAATNPETLRLSGADEVFIALYLEKSKLFKAKFTIDTICKPCYFQIKEKCKKEIKISA